MEEEYIFPVLASSGQYAGLIRTLAEQHDAAICITDKILSILDVNATDGIMGRSRLIKLMADFIRMYEPHSAREDTVIFPAFQQITTPERYRRLGRQFKKMEEEKFGPDGFAKIIWQVSEIEKTLGIHTLSRFTAPCQNAK